MKSWLPVLILMLGSTVSSAQTDPQSVISLTLQQCIEIVTQSSTGVLQSVNQNDLNGVQVLESYGQFLPNLLASGSYGYSTGATLYSIEGRTLVNSKGTNASLGLSTSLNLFNGLADFAGLKSALALKKSSEFSLDWAKEQVALDLTQTYLQLVLDQQILDIAQKNLVASESRLKLLQGQSEVGAASVSDLYRQQAETSADEFVVTNDQSRVQDDQVALIRKLRIDPSKAYRFESPSLDPAPSAQAEKGVDQLVKETLERRSDVRSNVALVDSTDWGVTRARSGYLPKLDLTFSRDAAGTVLSQDLVNGVDMLAPNQPGLPSQIGNQVQYTIGLTLSWSIFDRFVTHYNVAQADTVLKNTQIALDDSKLQVQSDIRIAYTNYGSAKNQLGSAKMGVEAAQKSYDAVNGMYEVGSASIVDVLTAQAALVQARSNYAQALTNLKLQEKTLEYATGSLVDQNTKEN